MAMVACVQKVGRYMAGGALVWAVCFSGTPAHALSLGGSVGFDVARVESSTSFATTTQTQFGQSYQLNVAGGLLLPQLGQWNGGFGYRRDLTQVAGFNGSDQDIKLFSVNAGVTLLPNILPMTFSFSRSVVDDNNSVSARNAIHNTVSLTTRVPVGLSDPLAVALHQTRQSSGFGSTTSRLASLSQRLNLGERSQLNTSYQFSQFSTPDTESTGHALSLNERSKWSENLQSSLQANLSSRSSTATQRAGGRSLFLNNSIGGGLSYHRGRTLSASLHYNFSESPQDQLDSITTQLLSVRTNIRASKKLDIRSYGTLRRLNLGNTRLDTSTLSVSMTYRPRFGWSTGGQFALSNNQTVSNVAGGTDDSRNTVSGGLFLAARTEFDVGDVSWGGSSGYSINRGNSSAQLDRLTSSVYATFSERVLQQSHWSADYRMTHIRESNTGNLPVPFSFEHGVNVTGTMEPRYGLFRAADSLTAQFRAGMDWNHRSLSSRSFRGRSVIFDAHYQPAPSLVTSMGYSLADNSSTQLGTRQTLSASVGWTQRVFRRGQGRLRSDVRRSLLGGEFESQEASLEYTFDYALGLVRIAFSADVVFVDLAGTASGNNRNNIRLNITRTF